MTCHSYIGVTMTDAAYGEPTASAYLPDMHSPRAGSMSVPRIVSGQRIAAPRTLPDLTARAVRVCNRNKAETARYLELHRTLASRICSEVHK